MNKSLYCLAAALIMAFPAPAAAEIINAKLKSGQKAITAVCVMPVETDWKKRALLSRDARIQEADAFNAALHPVIVESVIDAGWRDESAAVSAEVRARDEDVRQAVLELQSKFDSLQRLIERKRSGIRRGRYTLGDAVMLAPCAARSDAILFVRAEVQTAPVRHLSTSFLFLTFADAKSGEILAQTTVKRVGDGFQSKTREFYGPILADRFRIVRMGGRRKK